LKIRAIAMNTFMSFLRNKVILLFCALFACVVGLMMSPLLVYKAMRTAANVQPVQELALSLVAGVMSLVSGFGSLLAVWAAADAIADEMKSGTILAVMARPLHRWQFLAGKYLGVLMLMATYVLGMLGVTFLLAWLGGQHVDAAVAVLLAYPLVRYAIWAAISTLLVTFMRPVAVVGVAVVLTTVIGIFGSTVGEIPAWIRLSVHRSLPLTDLLSEQRFLNITQASLKAFPWSNHLTILAYGLDYALVCFLLAVAVFNRRSLTRD
jgi:ABC-type transport system involved in multi-copper enzyme maturation permease subunit